MIEEKQEMVLAEVPGGGRGWGQGADEPEERRGNSGGGPDEGRRKRGGDCNPTRRFGKGIGAQVGEGQRGGGSSDVARR